MFTIPNQSSVAKTTKISPGLVFGSVISLIRISPDSQCFPAIVTTELVELSSRVGVMNTAIDRFIRS